MGEMADYINYEFCTDESLPQPVRTKTCRCCGKDGLVWVHVVVEGKLRWLLGNVDGSIHICPSVPLKGVRA